MKALTISDAATVVLGLQDEIRRSNDSRYDHRLHAVLLVAQGQTPRHVAQMLGDAPRTVEYWVTRFEKSGLGGLAEGERSGRPSRLTAAQMRRIESALRKSPRDAKMNVALWDGPTLSAFIVREFNVQLGPRQCQRMFRNFGFRFRKPRGVIAQGDPARRTAYKKNSGA